MIMCSRSALCRETRTRHFPAWECSQARPTLVCTGVCIRVLFKLCWRDITISSKHNEKFNLLGFGHCAQLKPFGFASCRPGGSAESWVIRRDSTSILILDRTTWTVGLGTPIHGHASSGNLDFIESIDMNFKMHVLFSPTGRSAYHPRFDGASSGNIANPPLAVARTPALFHVTYQWPIVISRLPQMPSRNRKAMSHKAKETWHSAPISPYRPYQIHDAV